MKIQKNKNDVILTDKIPLAVSASKRTVKTEDGKNKIKKRFYTYRLTIPRILVDLIFKEKFHNETVSYNVLPKFKKKFVIIPTETRKYYLSNNPNRMNLNLPFKRLLFEYYTLEKNKESYKITLPKASLIELLAIDKYMDTLNNVKDRTPIYLYFKLKITPIENKNELTFRFTNKYANNEVVRLFKKRLSENKDLGDVCDYYLNCLQEIAMNKNGTIDNMRYILSENPVSINNRLRASYSMNYEEYLKNKKIFEEEIKNFDLENIKKGIEIWKTENNPWDLIIDQNLINEIKKNEKIFDFKDIWSKSLEKYKGFEKIFILFKDIAIETSIYELYDFLKEYHLYCDNVEEFIALFLIYKRKNKE